MNYTAFEELNNNTFKTSCTNGPHQSINEGNITAFQDQVSRNWNTLHTHYLKSNQVSHQMQSSQSPEGASSRLRRIGNSCITSIVGIYSKVP